jgi:hypothetical protein
MARVATTLATCGCLGGVAPAARACEGSFRYIMCDAGGLAPLMRAPHRRAQTLALDTVEKRVLEGLVTDENIDSGLAVKLMVANVSEIGLVAANVQVFFLNTPPHMEVHGTGNSIKYRLNRCLDGV